MIPHRAASDDRKIDFPRDDARPERDESADFAMGRDMPSIYVPLMPDTNLRVHDAHDEVPAPAFTTAVPAEPCWYIPG